MDLSETFTKPLKDKEFFALRSLIMNESASAAAAARAKE